MASEIGGRILDQRPAEQYCSSTVSVNLKRDEFRVSNWFHDRVGECARTLEAEVCKVKVFCGYMVNGAHEEVKFSQGVTEARRVANGGSGEKTRKRTHRTVCLIRIVLETLCPVSWLYHTI